MTGSTALDIRLPIGGLFTALGLLLTGYGVATAGDTSHYARSLSVNINLWWGLVLLVFGVLMLLGAGLGKGKRSALETTEGQATEARERQQDLER